MCICLGKYPMLDGCQGVLQLEFLCWTRSTVGQQSVHEHARFLHVSYRHVHVYSAVLSPVAQATGDDAHSAAAKRGMRHGGQCARPDAGSLCYST